MDKIKKYESLIISLLEPISQVKFSDMDTRHLLVADRQSHNYLILTLGWDNNVQIHHCSIHVSIMDGKIWIQNNMTDVELAGELRELGVPKSDIVIGFLSPKMREYSDYAVA